MVLPGRAGNTDQAIGALLQKKHYMKKVPAVSLFLLLTLSVYAQTELDYYLPGQNYNPAVPTPGSVIGYDIGDWHLTHDKLTHYLIELAKASDRIVYREYSWSWENRPLFHLIITRVKAAIKIKL